MSKEIDISAIKKGDKVLAELEVVDIFDKYVEVADREGDIMYISAHQIKQHTPMAFDWAEVKQGMAFYHSGDTMGIVYRYVAKPINSGGLAVCERSDEGYGEYEQAYLTRAPEHDVKGVSYE